MSAMLPKISLGAGCFWGTEAYLKRFNNNAKKNAGGAPPLTNIRVGYQGGRESSTYKQVCSGTTGHAEVAHCNYDPSAVDLKDLLIFFFSFHNSTTLNRQGNDAGTQYRSTIFVYDTNAKETAERIISEFNTPGSELNGKLVKAFGAQAKCTTLVEDGNANPFFPAEDYHQAYLDSNPGGYCNHQMYM